MNIRGSLKVSRDAAVIFARTFRRDRQRSFTTIPLQIGSRDLATCSSQTRRYPAIPTPLAAVHGQGRSFSNSVDLPVGIGKQAWLGNANGGLRKGDKGEYYPAVSKRSS